MNSTKLKNTGDYVKHLRSIATGYVGKCTSCEEIKNIVYVVDVKYGTQSWEEPICKDCAVRDVL